MTKKALNFNVLGFLQNLDKSALVPGQGMWSQSIFVFGRFTNFFKLSDFVLKYYVLY